MKTRATKKFQERRDFFPHKFVVLLKATAATSLFFSLSNCQMSKIRQFIPLIPWLMSNVSIVEMTFPMSTPFIDIRVSVKSFLVNTLLYLDFY